jgi:tRNA (guanine37-N1)-methyltransferase
VTAIAFDVITLFPGMFGAITEHGITGRARDRGLYSIDFWNPRQFATDVHRTVDDRPYGGGPGMVMLPGPLEMSIDAARARQMDRIGAAGPVVCLSPQGRRLTHGKVTEIAKWPAVVLVCGRYEGIDERLIELRVDEELSIGDFVISGGELGAMMLIDAVVRQLPGSLNDTASANEESFADSLLDYPQYTRPEEYRGRRVPEVLLSGNHERIRRWRLRQALERTRSRRPDLLAMKELTLEERELIEEIERESGATASHPVTACAGKSR